MQKEELGDMGIVVVEVCDINPICLLDLESLEEEFPGVTVLRTSCLSNCNMCAVSPYAYVNGELLTGETPEDVMSQIRVKIVQELEQLQG
jgi:uncharacterized protein YuzB (UPF0349 family)